MGFTRKPTDTARIRRLNETSAILRGLREISAYCGCCKATVTQKYVPLGLPVARVGGMLVTTRYAVDAWFGLELVRNRLRPASGVEGVSEEELDRCVREGLEGFKKGVEGVVGFLSEG